MSALPPTADIRQCAVDVRKAPIADLGRTTIAGETGGRTKRHAAVEHNSFALLR